MAKKPKKDLEPMSVRDILSTVYPKDDWVVEKLIPAPSLTAISGAPASFKTWITLHLALSVSGHKEFLGHFTVPFGRKVLFLDQENHPKHLKARYEALKADRDAYIQYVFDDDIDLGDVDDIERLLTVVKQEEIGLVVIDSLVRYHRADENVAREMAGIFRNLKKIVTAGSSVIFTHHHRKEAFKGQRVSGASMRGSSDIFAAVDCHIALEYDKEEKMITFDHVKLRQAPAEESFAAKVEHDDTTGAIEFEYGGKHDRNKRAREEAKDAIEAAINESQEDLSLAEITERVGDEFKDSVLRSAIKELVQEKRLTEQKRAHNKRFYGKSANPTDTE